MGVSPTTETRLGEHGIRPPSTRFATPDPEVRLACRLALNQYLESRLPGCLELIHELLQDERDVIRSRSTRNEWRALRAVLLDTVVLDPACGEGHFLMGMLNLLNSLGRRLDALIGLREDSQTRKRRILERCLYGVEVDEQAASQCRHRLRRALYNDVEHSQPAQDGLRLNIFLGDSLLDGPDFSWSSNLPEICRRGGFDLAVGNPPYVRHERIVDPTGRLSKEKYKDRVTAQLLSRLPRAYGQADVKRVSRPNGRSDLSLLFTLHALSLLRHGGVLSFILPTALFQAGYGQTLQSAMQEMHRDGQILESDWRRSFANAGINTAIFVAGDWGSSRRPSTAVHRQLSDTQAGPRPGRVIAKGYPAHESTADRLASQLLSRLSDYVAPLGSLGHVRYSLKTGINRFFYPDGRTVARFGIAEFCRPVLRSPRIVKRIHTRPDDVDTVVFICERSCAELEREGHQGALSYIQWGSHQRTATGVAWPSVASVRGRPHWHALSVPETADIVCQRFFDRRFFFLVPDNPMPEDQTFYGLVLSPYNVRIRTLVAALLNSSLSYLWVETHGRTGLGEGVRQYGLRDMAALPVISPQSLAAGGVDSVSAAFQALEDRPIMSIEQEVNQADRLALDAAVGDLLGLPLSVTRTVRSTLVELVSRRMAKARSA